MISSPVLQIPQGTGTEIPPIHPLHRRDRPKPKVIAVVSLVLFVICLLFLAWAITFTALYTARSISDAQGDTSTVSSSSSPISQIYDSASLFVQHASIVRDDSAVRHRQRRGKSSGATNGCIIGGAEINTLVLESSSEAGVTFLTDASAVGVVGESTCQKTLRQNYVTYDYNQAPCTVPPSIWLGLWQGAVQDANANFESIYGDLVVPPAPTPSSNASFVFSIWGASMQPQAFDPPLAPFYANACDFQGSHSYEYLNGGHFQHLKAYSDWATARSEVSTAFNSIGADSWSPNKWFMVANIGTASDRRSQGYGYLIPGSGSTVTSWIDADVGRSWQSGLKDSASGATLKMAFNQSVWEAVLDPVYPAGTQQGDLLRNNVWRFGLFPYTQMIIYSEPGLEAIPTFWPNATEYMNVHYTVSGGAGVNGPLFDFVGGIEVEGSLFGNFLFISPTALNEYVTVNVSTSETRYAKLTCVNACIQSILQNSLSALAYDETTGSYSFVFKFVDTYRCAEAASGWCRVSPPSCSNAYWTQWCGAQSAAPTWCSGFV